MCWGYARQRDGRRDLVACAVIISRSSMAVVLEGEVGLALSKFTVGKKRYHDTAKMQASTSAGLTVLSFTLEMRKTCLLVLSMG